MIENSLESGGEVDLSSSMPELRQFRWAVAAALLFGLAGSASADIVTLGGSLLGSNEVPPTGSSATGFALVSFDSVLNTLTLDVSFSGLTGTTTAAHIHCCVPVGGNAPVATTVPAFAGFPLGVTSGTYHGVLDLTLPSSFNPAFITANGGTTAQAEATLVAGFQNFQTYLNVHTSTFGGGEIRANLVPEPGTTILLAICLTGLVVVRKRWSTSR